MPCDRCDAVSTTHRIHADNGDPVMLNEDEELVVCTLVCEECRDRFNGGSELANCPVCGILVRENDLSDTPATAHHESIMCSRCVNHHLFVCVACDELQNNSERWGESDNGPICMGCSDDYGVCDSCGCVRPTDDLSYSDRNGEYYCSGCDRPESEHVHDYCYKPAPVFHGSPNGRAEKGKLYYGCELEVELNNSDMDEKAEEVLDKLGEDHVYLKEDGSINHGFEIVTHPHTWEAITKLWKEDWYDGVKGLKSHDTDTCGFHIHVSRKELTRLHIQKIVVFINAPENWGFVKRIAQRDASQWAALKTGKTIGKCGTSYDRYEAVNICNDHTIEFRIFKGNLKRDRILKNLQFVKATIDFTRDRSYRELSSDKFVEFVSTNRKAYPELHAFIKETENNERNS